MKFRSLGYCIGQGFKNIVRNRIFSLASVTTMTLCIFLIGIFYSIVSNVSYNVENLPDKLCIKVFFDYGITEERIESIGNTIMSNDGVNRIYFVSKEEAWEDYKNTYFGEEYKDIADDFENDNPLANSESYNVYIKDASKQGEIENYILSIDGVRKINSHKSAADGLSEISTIVSFFSIAVIGLLIAVALFLISTTIANGITVRKDEIEIMRLLGARNSFIRAPFIVEGITIGIIGAAIPLGIVYFIYDIVVKSLLPKFSFLGTILAFQPVNEIYTLYIPVACILGVGLGLLGSIISLAKHLKV